MLSKGKSTRAVAVVVLVGMLISVVLAGVLSFYASSEPDGLEKVAQDAGFADSAKDSANADSALADYGVAGVDDPRASVAGAGLIGVAITAAAGFALFALLKPRKAASNT